MIAFKGDFEIIKNLYQKSNVESFKVRVFGDSMFPTIISGQTITLIPVNNPLNIEVGDVIAFLKFDNHFTVHRVITKKIFLGKILLIRTKGDNKKKKDKYFITGKKIFAKMIE